MGALLNKSSNKEVIAAAPVDKTAEDTKPTTTETAENKENSAPPEVDSAKPGSGDTAEVQAKTEPEPQPAESAKQSAEPEPAADQPAPQPEPQQQETKQEEHSTDANDAASQPETATEQKGDQEQETGPAEDASSAPEVNISQEVVAGSTDVGESTETAESTGENPPEQPTETCTANGPVDEVPKKIEEMTPKDKVGEEPAVADAEDIVPEGQSSDMTAVVEG